MTELENRIYAEISKAKGIKGGEIANKLGIEKTTVNSALFNSFALKALVKQEPDHKWYLIGTQDKTGGEAPPPDKKLKALCDYYLECISKESSNNVDAFLTSKFELDYAVLNGLGVDTQVDTDAIELLAKINANNKMVAYLGYPCCIYSFRGKNGAVYKKIAPVFLFPVNYSLGHVTISWVPKINMEVVKRYCPLAGESSAMELVRLETELGMNAVEDSIEPDELALRLYSLYQWEWREKIDPYNIPKADKLDKLQDGFYNRPIIISAEKSVYTHGLETELMTLSNMPKENYKNTALDAWINGNDCEPEKGLKPIIEVLPLNTEQSLAVETALSSDLTIVTGPPGTGKSQVVTDLLINIAWNEKSALFSSKNNKAVDVVEARTNGLCEKPVLIRLGGANESTHLAELAETIMHAVPASEDDEEYHGLLSEYERLSKQLSVLKGEKAEAVKKRNELDALEKKYCEIREEFPFNNVPEYAKTREKLQDSLKKYRYACDEASKEKQKGINRLLWPLLKNKRIMQRKEAEEEFKQIISRLIETNTDQCIGDCDSDETVKLTESYIRKLTVAIDYRNAYKSFLSAAPLEETDKKITAVLQEQSQSAKELWNKWLSQKTVRLSAEEKEKIASFITEVKLATGVVGKKGLSVAKILTQYFNCWATTSLSANSQIPFIPAFFDYVIIDEASQCDIASMLPLLFRTKHAVIIGDPKQLRHIATIPKQQDNALIEKFGVSKAWSYSVNSLYDLANSKVKNDKIIGLRDHFRSCEEITGFSNKYYYDGSLRVATKYEGLRCLPGAKPGIRWIDVKGIINRPKSGSAYNEAEARAIVQELDRLVQVGYLGSIGVVTPLKAQAEKIKAILEKEKPDVYTELCNKHALDVNTIHAFQGDERDIVLFSSVVTDGSPDTILGWYNNTGNLFNVAITRARAHLVVVGDFDYCLSCPIKHLRAFAEYYRKIQNRATAEPDQEEEHLDEDYPVVSNPDQVSEWERVFYSALFRAGIKTIPQYPADKYALDLALILGNTKLDIEVDGERYHKSWNGELCYRDQLRNQRLFELGWDVKRFWVYQIRDDLDGCIEQVRRWIEKNK